MITRLTFDQISTAVHDAYEACKDIKGGQNAHYIPYLANVNSDLFGISLCLPDGRLISVGDTDYRFGIESVSKVHTAILALEQHGAQAILDDIGADATGKGGEFSATLQPKVTLGGKVGDVCKYAESGEVDIAMVYTSDVYRMGGVAICSVVPNDTHKAITLSLIHI